MSYCWCDGELPEFCRVTQVKRARKRHKCWECGAYIQPGSPYEYVCGKWDGLLDRFRICPLCKELREWATISVPCFCWAYGSLHDDVWDMVDETRHDVPGFYFEYGRRMIRIKRARKASRENKHDNSPA